MNYTNESVRRQDRLLPKNEALEMLRNAEYGILSMVNINGEGYGIPINFVWDNNKSIYFHCAPEGEKLNNISANKKVSFCVVGHTSVVPDKFTTQYESVIIKGSAHIKLSDEEKMNALMLILDKYSPDFKEIGIKYSEKSFHRTEIIRLDIETISGKCKR